MTRNILKYPDLQLRRVAKPVLHFDDALARLAQDMIETMYAEKGVGLAATQVGEAVRLLVLDVSDERDAPLALVNPAIRLAEGEILFEEGCLSVPGIREEVIRAAHVIVAAQDLLGKPLEIEGNGLLSVCLQHEMDHLDGKVFLDRLSRLKRGRIEKRIEKQQKEASCA